ncbi:Tn3 family transposase [Picosynechococcus sp. PCC 73109]|uniref:Tn3 family transposase n=1 Tax=Picosynechococcus sp. PCC 73109 TaxID=374982 RepID=UPI0007457D91|nr:Tn3 family transposase [Picosynechococcus sp. PCC 73109]AMA10684.1 hypothetical protein AWQ23_14665 [Picosynechococcus sp. PCC 73109]
MLQRAGLTAFADPEPVLEGFNEALLQQYKCTNQNAAANHHLKFRADGKSHVSVPALENNEAEPFEEWFPQRQDVPLAQVLGTINNHCGMLKAFILRYIDELELRQAIEQQLNKVELANKFTRAVAVGSPREFAQVEKEEQAIAEACNRLIKNSIICWNYLYLSRRLEESANAETKDKLRRAIATHSPISWAHINMLGEYDFSAEKLKDSLGILPLKSAA